jgi:endo-1,4-beta-xylanase
VRLKGVRVHTRLRARRVNENGMTVRGNQLIWHAFLPPYLSTLGPAELRAEMESYIRTVLGHFRGHVSSWVVVNEAVNFGGAGLRSSLWLQQLGPGYIADAFRIAHDADPDAELLYSDVLADGINHTSDYIYTMLQDLLVQGVPVHGIALQMHLGDGFGPAPDSIIENMQRFAALGLNVHVSEMDVQIAGLPGVDTAAKLQAQRNVYYTVVGNCVVVPGCRSITFWGFTDNHSWLDAGGFSDTLPLPFDTQYQPKPAYRGVRNALAGH